jgi:hypothetical protein
VDAGVSTQEILKKGSGPNATYGDSIAQIFDCLSEWSSTVGQIAANRDDFLGNVFSQV